MNTTMNKRDMILDLLAAFVRQRPGLEFGNYGDVKMYRSEMRSITRDRHIAERLLADVRWRTSIDEARLRDAFRAYSGRLSLIDKPDGSMALDYCTGQYFPTEYRKAVCAVLASALLDNARDNMPAPVGKIKSTIGYGPFRREIEHDSINGKSPGDYLRSKFRREYGRSIASRYFD